MGIFNFALINSNTKIMQKDDKLLGKMILSNTLALCFTSFLDATCVFVDEMVAAREVGDNAMVAIGLSSPMFYIICIFTSVFAFGAQSVCSYHISNGDKKASNSVFSALVLISAISAIILTVALLIFLDPICNLFGAYKSDPKVFDLLHDYLMGLIWVVPGYVGFVSFSPFVILDGNRKCIWMASIVQLVTSVIGDYIFVFIFNEGLYGVGMATGIGYILASVVLATDFRKGSLFHFSVRSISFKYFGKIIWIGSPRFYKYICGFLIEIFVNRIVIILGGKIAVAVFSIVNTVSTYLYMIGYGVSESAVYATQLLYGEHARKELHRMIKIVVKLSLIVTCIIMIIVIFMSKSIAGIFVKTNGEMFTHTTWGLVFLALSVPIYTLNCVIAGYLQGARKVVYAKIITLNQKFLGYTAMAIVLGYFFGPMGLYASVPVGEIVTLLVYFIMACFYKKADTFKDKLLLIPKSFDEDIKYSFVFDIRNNDDIIRVSKEATNLLQKKGYTDKRGLFNLNLSIEEIVGNVVSHGFDLDGKVHSCSIRIMLYSNDSITICVRDDCPKFNIKEAYKNINDQDVYSNFGLKLIFGISKEVSYNHLIGFNNTIVKI